MLPPPVLSSSHKVSLSAVLTCTVLAAVIVAGCDKGSTKSPLPPAEAGTDDAGGTRQAQCAGLDQLTCESQVGCSAVHGTDGTGASVYAGCRSSGPDAPLCNTVLTCAYSTGPSATCLRFGDTCVPEGWKVDVACESAGCPSTDAGIAAGDASVTGCSALDKDTCGATANCATVFGTDEAGYARYAGCRYNGADAQLCNTVLTCGQRGGGGLCLRFSDTCLPEGWTADISCGAAGCPGGLDAGADVNPINVCTGLDKETCSLMANCAPVSGTDQAGVTTYAGCRYNGPDARLCNTVLTCGHLAGGGVCLRFGDTCLPEGWIADVACQTPGCPVVPL